jgi:pimeloyl-[acyl-carrier protein] methyl ester esterase
MTRLQVIAMHGWAGSAAGWAPFQAAAEDRGWRWRSGERGYGDAPARLPAWEPEGGLRVVIGHSMGIHLLPPALLAAAERVVLLASFGRFVPPGREGRAVKTALAAMDAALADGPDPGETALRAQGLLRTFLAEAAAPDPPHGLPPGPADQPVGPAARQLLRHDLARLEASRDLPAGFPEGIPVLLVEAGEDRIVGETVRQLLRQRLPAAERILLPRAGHAFLSTPPQAAVCSWLEETLADPPAR